MPGIEHKHFAIKALTEEGSVQAVISTFGQIDRDGDIMLADAFKSSNGKSIPMVWSHDWGDPVGKGIVSATPTEAVYTGQFFMDTARGQEAYKTVKAMGDLQEYSIGFRIVEDTWGFQDDGAGGRKSIRTINNIELFEASPVLVGAAYGTRTLAVKGAKVSPRDFEGALVVAKQLTLTDETLIALDTLIDAIENAAEAIEALLGIEDEPEQGALIALQARRAWLIEKAGRVMNQTNLDRLHSAAAAIADIHAGTCDMEDDCPLDLAAAKTAKPTPPKHDARRLDLELALAGAKEASSGC